MLENVENFGVYVLYDDTTEKYGLPFVALNNEEAIRSCITELYGLDDVILSDMRLFEIGQYYHDDGTIEGYPSDSHFLVCDSDTLLSKITSARERMKVIKEEARKELEELKKLKDSKGVK